LPEADVEVAESKGGFAAYGNTGASRFDEMTHFGSSYGTPGWQRAQARGRFGHDGFDDDGEGYSTRDGAMDDPASSPSPRRSEGGGGGGGGGVGGGPPVASRARGFRSPSKANSSPNPPAPSPTSRSATASSTKNSAMATSPPSTATSSPSNSTRRARSAWWIVL